MLNKRLLTAWRKRRISSRSQCLDRHMPPTSQNSVNREQRKECFALAGVAQWIEHWPVNQRSLVRFPVRAHAWVVGQVPSRECVKGNHTLMFLSLSFSSLPSSLSKNL